MLQPEPHDCEYNGASGAWNFIPVDASGHVAASGVCIVGENRYAAGAAGATAGAVDTAAGAAALYTAKRDDGSGAAAGAATADVAKRDTWDRALSGACDACRTPGEKRTTGLAGTRGCPVEPKFHLRARLEEIVGLCGGLEAQRSVV